MIPGPLRLRRLLALAAPLLPAAWERDLRHVFSVLDPKEREQRNGFPLRDEPPRSGTWTIRNGH